MKNSVVKLMVLLSSIVIAFACSDKEKPEKLTVQSEPVEFAAIDPEPVEVEVLTENLTSWSFEFEDAADEEWLTVTKTAKGLLLKPTNNLGAAREAVVLLSGGATIKDVPVNITQEVFVNTITLDKEKLYFSPAGTPAQTVTVTTVGGVEWDVEIVEGEGKVTITKNESSFDVTLTANGAEGSKTYKIAVTSSAAETKEVEIEQFGDYTQILGTYTVTGTRHSRLPSGMQNPETWTCKITSHDAFSFIISDFAGTEAQILLDYWASDELYFENYQVGLTGDGKVVTQSSIYPNEEKIVQYHLSVSAVFDPETQSFKFEGEDGGDKLQFGLFISDGGKLIPATDSYSDITFTRTGPLE